MTSMAAAAVNHTRAAPESATVPVRRRRLLTHNTLQKTATGSALAAQMKPDAGAASEGVKVAVRMRPLNKVCSHCSPP